MADDEFGIRMIYPTNKHPNRAKPWLMGKDNWLKRKYNGVGDWNDCPFSTDENGDTVINFDTKFIVNDPLGSNPNPVYAYGDKGRLPVLAIPSEEYIDDNGNFVVVSRTKQSYLRKRGFMGTKNDWKNLEVTLYWKTYSTYDRSPDANGMGFSVRGGPHHSDTLVVGAPCEGTALYVGVSHGGYSAINKELGHPSYADSVNIENLVNSDLMDRWIGMKGVFYNKANGNPYIELWLDRNNNNNWEFVLNYEDEGNWFLKEDTDHDGILWREDGSGNPYSHHGNFCDGKTNEKVTWGGPGVIFKIMGLTRVDIKWGSIREIMPPEGWPVRYLLDARSVSFPYSMRALAEEHGLTPPVSLRQLIELEAEFYPFS